MSRQRGATAVPEQAEAVVEQIGGSTDPKGADTTGRELNGKCDPVKPAATPSHNRRIDITQCGAIAARRRPLHEKLGSGIAKHFHGSKASILRWTIKRI
jgi:hypothetical protein